MAFGWEPGFGEDALLEMFGRLDWRKIITVFITFFIAWATGHAMQNSDRIAEILGMDTPPDIENLRLAAAQSGDPILPDDPDALSANLPAPPLAALRQARLEMPGGKAGRLSMRAEGVPPGDLFRPREFGPFGLACGPVVRAEPAGNAKVRISINAPCRGGEGVVISHGPLELSARISKAGIANIEFPALARRAAFVVRLEKGDGELRAFTEVPDFAGFERVALFWEGDADLRIHAAEMGFGGAEHSAGSGGGETVRFEGAGARKAEIYSFPAVEAMRSGVVRLIVEARVDESTCNRAIEATAMQKNADGRLDPVAIVLQMPGCDHIGQTLVLKNVLKDMKIASN